jgi:hypothetical protein
MPVAIHQLKRLKVAAMAFLNRYKTRRMRARLSALLARRAVKVPAKWIGRPPSLKNREVVLFVTYSPDATITPTARCLIDAWKAAGFAVIIILAVDDMQQPALGVLAEDCVLVRANQGYDFGAWAGAIARLPDVQQAALLAIANDSVYGPTARFSEMVDEVRRLNADVIGLTDSRELNYHIQSYLVFFKSGALKHLAFRWFWRSIRTLPRQSVIDLYETRLSETFALAGLSSAVLHPVPVGFNGNITLTDWKGLLHRGFPFVKIQLVRDNPFNVDISDWAEQMDELGYRSAIALRDLVLRRSRGSVQDMRSQ